MYTIRTRKHGLIGAIAALALLADAQAACSPAPACREPRDRRGERKAAADAKRHRRQQKRLRQQA